MWGGMGFIELTSYEDVYRGEGERQEFSTPELFNSQEATSPPKDGEQAVKNGAPQNFQGDAAL